MFNNLILDMGLEAFEDGASDVVALPYSEPVAADVANDLVVARDLAVETADIAVAESEVMQQMTEIQTLANAENQMDNLGVALEHFIENGCTPAVAQMLSAQLGEMLSNVGSSLTVVTNGGLESFDDADAVKGYLTAGLEALNNEKGTIGTKIAGGLVNINQSLNGFVERIVTRAGRMRARAQSIIKQANAASGKRHVKVKSKFLAVKGDKATTNLAGDLAKFTSVVTGLGSDYLAKAGTYANGQVVTALNKVKTAVTLVEARKLVDTIVPPPYPGANINIKDTPELTLKRTEVTLGGYAVFDLRYKTTGGDSVGEICSSIKAVGKARISLKRPKEEKGDKVVFEADMTPADAIAICKEVIKCCDAALAIQRNAKWVNPFAAAVAGHVRGLRTAMESNSKAESGVGTVAYTLTKLPTTMVNGVMALVLEVPGAVGNVCDAVLDVAAQAARGGKEESAPKDDKADKDDKAE